MDEMSDSMPKNATAINPFLSTGGNGSSVVFRPTVELTMVVSVGFTI